MRSLRRGLEGGDTLAELQSRLRSLPDDLYTFFKQMLDSVEPFYHAQSARIIQLRLFPASDFSVMTLSFFAEDSVDFALALQERPWSQEELEHLESQAAKRILARCTDILQIRKGRRSVDQRFGYLHVDFIHRTAKEFLLERDIQELLLSRSSYTLPLAEFFCASYLAQIKFLNLSQPNSEHAFASAMAGLIQSEIYLETYNQRACIQVLNDLESLLLRSFDPWCIAPMMEHLVHLPASLDKTFSQALIVLLAIEQGLDRYVEYRILDETAAPISEQGWTIILSMLVRGSGRLWETSRDPNSNMGVFVSDEVLQDHNLRLLELLLKRGIPVNKPPSVPCFDAVERGDFAPNTAWTIFLEQLLQYGMGTKQSSLLRYYLSVLELFVENCVSINGLLFPGDLPHQFTGQVSALSWLDVVELVFGKACKNQFMVKLRAEGRHYNVAVWPRLSAT